jgi:hypothetical protein
MRECVNQLKLWHPPNLDSVIFTLRHQSLLSQKQNRIDAMRMRLRTLDHLPTLCRNHQKNTSLIPNSDLLSARGEFHGLSCSQSPHLSLRWLLIPHIVSQETLVLQSKQNAIRISRVFRINDLLVQVYERFLLFR